MSEPRGPLDAAIEVLGTWELWNVTRTDYDAAIRVLEAAGGMNKRAIEFFLQEATEPRAFEISSQDLRALYSVGKRGVEALIEALPDKEKE